jgi:hypothetical protein
MNPNDAEAVRIIRRLDLSVYQKLGKLAELKEQPESEPSPEDLVERFNRLLDRTLAIVGSLGSGSTDEQSPAQENHDTKLTGNFKIPSKLIATSEEAQPLKLDFDETQVLELNLLVYNPAEDCYSPSITAQWFEPDGERIFYELISPKMFDRNMAAYRSDAQFILGLVEESLVAYVGGTLKNETEP